MNNIHNTRGNKISSLKSEKIQVFKPVKYCFLSLLKIIIHSLHTLFKQKGPTN